MSGAAGILLGSLVRNEQQAAGVALLLGLGLAALGGSMAWANDAFLQLVGNGASLVAILPQLAVLAAFAVALLVLASWRLHRVLTT